MKIEKEKHNIKKKHTIWLYFGYNDVDKFSSIIVFGCCARGSKNDVEAVLYLVIFNISRKRTKLKYETRSGKVTQKALG